MKTTALLLFWLAGAALLRGSPALAEEETTRVVQQVQDAVLTVLVERATGEAGQGTGLLIAKDRVLTCYHVVEGADRISVTLRDGTTVPITAVVDHDAGRDLATLLLAEPFPSITLPALGFEPPAQGAHVVVIGTPLGLEQTVSAGVVAAARTAPNGVRLLQLSAPISPGSSGSPVFLTDGTVVGIVSFRHRQGELLAFAVSCSELARIEHTDPVRIEDWAHASLPRALRLLREAQRIRETSGCGPDATAAFRLALDADPSNLDAMDGLAEALLNSAPIPRPTSALQEVVSLMKTALRTDPERTSSLALLAHALSQSGHPDPELEEQVLERLTRIDSEAGGLWLLRLSGFHEDRGEFAKAEAALRRLVDSDPTPRWRARHLGYLAGYLMDRHRHREAASLWEESLSLRVDEPGTSDTSYGSQAVVDMARAWTRLASCRWFLGQERGVLSACARALELLEGVDDDYVAHQDRAGPLLLTGAAWLRLGEPRRALEVLGAVVRDDTGTGFGDAYRRMSEAARLLGQGEDAIRHARVACERLPRDVGCHRTLAEALLAAGEPGACVDAMSKALTAIPDEPIPRYYLGVALVALGRLDDASRHCALLEKQDPARAGELRTLIEDGQVQTAMGAFKDRMLPGSD